MKKYYSAALCLSLFCLMPEGRAALTPSVGSRLNNSYLFIENEIDGEYFITPASLDPRISGANVWARYRTRQSSVGYMGYVLWTTSTSYYRDMWIDNSPINGPFRGIRCTTGNNCPASGYIEPEATDQQGFYKARPTGSGITGGYYGFASFTEAAYEYFRQVAVGATDDLTLNFCYTTTNYNAAAGERCRDQDRGTWNQRQFSATKLGHLSLLSTNAFQELWLASDGTPSLSRDDGDCELGRVSNTDGIICKIISYKLNQTANLSSGLNFRMYVDEDVLGFSPGSTTIKIGDGSSWYNYGSSTTYSRVFSNEGEYVYIFLSKTFLKKIVERGINIRDNNLFTFAFNNTNTVESGHYEFTPSLQLTFVPKEYGISIITPDDAITASGSGNIGDDTPIELDYIVTVSGPRQADHITAQVIGESTLVGGMPYCLFTSPDGNIEVPIPAYLQFTRNNGSMARLRNSCSEAPVSLNDARWEVVPWDENNNDDGSFYSTDLKLLFPMNDLRSEQTVSGHTWQGVVSATGAIKVTALWVGVDK